MKQFFSLAMMVFIFACNDNKTGVDTSRWKISDETAVKMKKYLKDCVDECDDNSRIVNRNREVYDAIRSGCNGCTITEVPARYKKDDEERYCKLRGLSGDTCKVRGYKTIIYMVQNKVTSGQASDIEFYDIVTICPPPRNCNQSDTSVSR